MRVEREKSDPQRRKADAQSGGGRPSEPIEPCEPQNRLSTALAVAVIGVQSLSIPR
jgi:hypothetical protein